MPFSNYISDAAMYAMLFSILNEMLPKIYIMEKYGFLKSIIRSQIMKFSVTSGCIFVSKYGLFAEINLPSANAQSWLMKIGGRLSLSLHFRSHLKKSPDYGQETETKVVLSTVFLAVQILASSVLYEKSVTFHSAQSLVSSVSY